METLFDNRRIQLDMTHIAPSASVYKQTDWQATENVAEIAVRPWTSGIECRSGRCSITGMTEQRSLRDT